MNPAALALLAHADALLSGSARVASGNSGRLAAFLGRHAVELLIDDRCVELGAPCPDGTTRSKISILKSLDHDDAGPALIYAWSWLSECCHQHAYELSPTVGEVRALCASVVHA